MNLEVLKKMGRIRRFQMDEYIIIEGEEGHNAFLLLSGTADVTIKAYKDRRDIVARVGESQRFFRPKAFKNSTNTIAALLPGAIIGEMSIVSSSPRSASVVVTSEEALCLVLDKENFYKVIETEPDIGLNMIEIMCKRIDKAMTKISYGSPVSQAIRKDYEYNQYKLLDRSKFAKALKWKPEYMKNALEKLSNFLYNLNLELSRQV
ncbi:MAG: cyclic nucleotide-binding domain-containing protein [Lachnospiraceae bacterium]|nr:cyclic nucleotide-binding domain-containing protein [Lachnospiraceae bacterium]